MHEAKVMLETIMRLYYMRHGFEIHDPWITASMAFIGNMAIDDLASNTANDAKILDYYRSTLILAAQGLKKQGNNYHVGTLVCIQIQNRMSPSDLQLVRTYISAAEANDTDQTLIAEHSHSEWPIPIIQTSGNLDDLRLNRLVKGYEEMNLEPEDVSSRENTPVPR